MTSGLCLAATDTVICRFHSAVVALEVRHPPRHRPGHHRASVAVECRAEDRPAGRRERRECRLCGQPTASRQAQTSRSFREHRAHVPKSAGLGPAVGGHPVPLHLSVLPGFNWALHLPVRSWHAKAPLALLLAENSCPSTVLPPRAAGDSSCLGRDSCPGIFVISLVLGVPF